jgi:tryptophan 2,3-dioxygenase
VEEGDPLMVEIKNVWNAYDNQNKTIKIIFEQYKTDAAAFYAPVEKKGITMLKVSEISGEIDNFLKQMKQRLAEVEKITAEQKQSLNSASNLQGSPAEIDRNNAQIIQAERLFKDFTTANARTEKLLAEFNAVTRDKEEVWTLPNMRPRTILTDMERSYTDLNAKISLYKAQWASEKQHSR